jgi:hypothetical protein
MNSWVKNNYNIIEKNQETTLYTHSQNVGKLPTVDEYVRIHQYQSDNTTKYVDIFFDGLLQINLIENKTTIGDQARLDWFHTIQILGFNGESFEFLEEITSEKYPS